MPHGSYTLEEVRLLLAIEADDARAADGGLRSALGSLGDISNSSAADGADLPLIVRWHDVRAARDRVVIEKRDREILERRARGEDEDEIAERTGLDRSTINRRFRATLEDTLAALGGTAPESKVSKPDYCLHCAARPRARAVAVRRTTKGMWQPVTPTGAGRLGSMIAEERQLAVCAACLPRESLGYLILRPQDVDAARRPATSPAGRPRSPGRGEPRGGPVRAQPAPVME